jgi:hypothetical protein
MSVRRGGSTLNAMAVINKSLTVYFYSLEPVAPVNGEGRPFELGSYPLAEVLDTITLADPASDTYRIREDLFGGETFCLVHADGPEPILGAYYRDNLARPIAEYKGEINELMMREGEALVDAAYAAFFPNDVVGLVRTSSKAPGFAKIGNWLTLIGGYSCGLFALREADALLQLDRQPSKLRSLYMRIRKDRIPAIDQHSPRVAAALRSASEIGGRSDEIGVELRSKVVEGRDAWARQLRDEIEALVAVLPDFEAARVEVVGMKRPINLLRATVQQPVKVPLINSKRVGPSEAADALFRAYEMERSAIDAAVASARSDS